MAIEVENWNDLDAIRNDLTEDYVLVNDIDQNSDGYDTHASETANSEAGWEPIGDGTNPFSGTLDLAGYSISDLYIDRPSNNNTGLIGQAESNAIIQNGTINVISVTARFGSSACVGQIIDSVQILDITTSGNIFGVRDDGVSSCGGVVGAVVFGTQKIERCFSSCNVEAKSYNGPTQAGGLIGALRDSPEVIGCGATGNVDGGTVGDRIGGLVGGMGVGGGSENETPKILNCYARGSVTGDEAVGGLVGWLNTGGTGSKATIEKSYSTGAVSGDTDVGGLLGSIETGSDYDILDSFWDTETSNQANSAGDETGKTTAEMKDRDTFTDTATTGLSEAWDMATVDTYDETKTWGIGDLGSTTINDGYPFLMTFQEEPVDTGVYSREDVGTLPGTDDDLAILYSTADKDDVSVEDTNRVGITGLGILIHQFKDQLASGPVTGKWIGQTTQTPSTATVYLQIFNQSTLTWETVDTNDSASVDTDFTLQGGVADSTDYISDGQVSFRVYQDV